MPDAYDVAIVILKTQALYRKDPLTAYQAIVKMDLIKVMWEELSAC